MNKFIRVGRDRFINVDNIRNIEINSESFIDPTGNPYSSKLRIRDDKPYTLKVVYMDNKVDYFHLTKEDYDNFIETINKRE